MATNKSASLKELVSAILPEHTTIESVVEPVLQQFNESVKQEIDEIVALRDAGQSVIPEVSFTQIAKTGFTDAQQDLIRQRGCVVVRGVIDEVQAAQWNEELERYLHANNYYEGLAKAIEQGDSVRAKHPNILDIYWSRPQLEIRQATQMSDVRRHLNALWQTCSSGPGSFNSNTSATYVDRVRVRQPGDQTHGIPPHVDSCTLEAWLSSESILRNYHNLLNGDWQRFDPFVATNRVNTDVKPHPESCGVFRTFQGWMALTPQGPHCGTLQLVPSSRCVGWMFLNMLYSSIRNENLNFPQPCEAYVLHEQKHADLTRGLTSIPLMKAGDTVWWHPDVVHAVEKSNLSTTNSSVVYLGNAPDCPRNTEYLKQQLEAFEKGINPPDFPAGEIESEYVDRGVRAHLSESGEEQMGYILDQAKQA